MLSFLLCCSILPGISKNTKSSLNLNSVKLQETATEEQKEQNEKLIENIQILNNRVFELEKKVKDLEIELLKTEKNNNNNQSEMFDYLTRNAALREVNQTKLFGRKNTNQTIEKIANSGKRD